MRILRFCRLFTIPDMLPGLAFAHLSALKQQVPLLYLIISINSAALAVTHLDDAPTLLVVLPAALLVLVGVSRGLFWWRLKLESVPEGRYLPMLRRTNRLTAVLSPSILFWALSMEHYDPTSSGLHALFFLALTSIGCIFCLTHLRSAAFIIAATILGPAVGFAFNQRQTEITAIAVNLLLVGLVILRILFIKHRDFVERAEQNERLKELGDQNLRLAETDVLTGLPNRRTFFPALEQMVAEHNGSCSPFLVAIIDLDGFKNINDRFGHVFGDRVLAAIADRLRSALPPPNLLARVGGDEFAVIIEIEPTADPCAFLSAAVHTAVGELVNCGDGLVRVGASTGIAWWHDGQSSTDLIERADYAMYEAKAAGGNAVILFAAEHEREIRIKGDFESALRHADLDNELCLEFQPIYDVDQQRTIAFEALARWDNVVLGRVPPDRFIVAAERIGIINDVTRILLGKLLEAMAGWPESVHVSFNLSTADIISSNAIDTITRMVSSSHVDPKRLHFEVTETAMLNDFARARAGLEKLKALGCALSLDDFGTGHSSLSHVHYLPVDKLKVDKSFTRALLTHATARSIVASIIGLAHGLGQDCIVEGVETAEQMIMLRGLGCRLMQGYLFSRPMPAAAIEGYLQMEKEGLTESKVVA